MRGHSRRGCPPRVCAGRGHSKCIRSSGDQRTGVGGEGGAEKPGWAEGGRMRVGNFLTALEVPVVALAGAASGRGASCERVRPLPPLPHFRLPPLPRSRLPGPVGPPGALEAQPHPGRRGSLPRPRRSLAGADGLSQRGRQRCSLLPPNLFTPSPVRIGRVNNSLSPPLGSATPRGQLLQSREIGIGVSASLLRRQPAAARSPHTSMALPCPLGVGSLFTSAAPVELARVWDTLGADEVGKAACRG
ncbi:uncharacterized protein LOC115892729 [Rhinopithecus roxellana]|uniref:uncharacterized protein LOC115892729 n=1 Tax=Rhinopithecus roxellana TaxID=61622 RepID=UPI0012374813|nr:uncharacterized protein LOC115892729 [Rhinopithecus roxellana]